MVGPELVDDVTPEEVVEDTELLTDGDVGLVWLEDEVTELEDTKFVGMVLDIELGETELDVPELEAPIAEEKTVEVRVEVTVT